WSVKIQETSLVSCCYRGLAVLRRFVVRGILRIAPTAGAGEFNLMKFAALLERRYALLGEICKMSGGDTNCVHAHELRPKLGIKFGMTPEETEADFDYLASHGFVDGSTDHFWITQKGVSEVERRLSSR